MKTSSKNYTKNQAKALIYGFCADFLSIVLLVFSITHKFLDIRQYAYEMSGQMKTLLDRMNSLYPKDYRFRDVYMLSVASEDGDYTLKRDESGLQGLDRLL